MAEQHFALRVYLGHRAQGDRQAAQSLADAEGISALADPALGLYFAQFDVGRVVDGRQLFRKRDRAGPVTASGSRQVQRIVRAAQIVAIAETVEFALAVLKDGEVEVPQDLELKRAMKALVLALGLRMIRAAMTNPDAEPDQTALPAHNV